MLIYMSLNSIMVIYIPLGAFVGPRTVIVAFASHAQMLFKYLEQTICKDQAACICI